MYYSISSSDATKKQFYKQNVLTFLSKIYKYLQTGYIDISTSRMY